jgi:hypothetical protein
MGARNSEVTVTAKLIKGTKSEIADAVARMTGEVREAIVFIEDRPSDPTPEPVGPDLFAEMEPYTVRVSGVDYSREAIYGAREGE